MNRHSPNWLPRRITTDGERGGPPVKHALGVALLLIVLLLTACGSQSNGDSGAYGGSQNHLHDLLALRGSPGTVLLATHIGLYRSHDVGHSWTEVAGGSGQAMDGLMIFKLSQSPIDPRRVYALAIPRPDNPSAAKAPPGIYVSADAGVTWRLATAASVFPTRTVFTIGAGPTSADQLFAVISGLNERGLYETDDAGLHWRQLPALPANSIGGILADPGQPHHLVMWSVASGLYVSGDDAQSWRGVGAIQGGVYSVTWVQRTLYAVGDAGVYLSTDDTGSFALADSNDTFSGVVASAADPTHAYALTGTSVYVSTNSGHTWTATAALSRHPSVLSADPSSAATAWVGLSYPLGVEVTTDGGATWKQTLP